MALVSLLLNKLQTRTTFRENGSDADILPIDCTITRTTNYENEVTMNPVEEGLDVTDHIRAKPITMQIDGVISETPLSIEGQKAALTTSGASFVNRQLGGFKGGIGEVAVGAGAGKLGSKLFQSGGSPAELGRKILENLIVNKQRFRVAVDKKILDDMVMTRLSIPEDQNNGYSLKFSCTLQQIRVVKGQVVQIERIARSAAHGAKQTNLGNQAATEATKEQRKSLAKSFASFLSGGK